MHSLRAALAAARALHPLPPRHPQLSSPPAREEAHGLLRSRPGNNEPENSVSTSVRYRQGLLRSHPGNNEPEGSVIESVGYRHASSGLASPATTSSGPSALWEDVETTPASRASLAQGVGHVSGPQYQHPHSQAHSSRHPRPLPHTLELREQSSSPPLSCTDSCVSSTEEGPTLQGGLPQGQPHDREAVPKVWSNSTLLPCMESMRKAKKCALPAHTVVFGEQ